MKMCKNQFEHWVSVITVVETWCRNHHIIWYLLNGGAKILIPILWKNIFQMLSTKENKFYYEESIIQLNSYGLSRDVIIYK